MHLRRIAAGITLVMMLAACSSAAPSGSTPPAVTPAPVASATPVPDASATPPAATTPPATATAPGASQGPNPSFAGDPELAARFPTQVDGQPVTNVTTARLVDFLRAFNTPEAEIDSDRQKLATIGIDLDTITMGSANATVSGLPVGILAYRLPGQDANKLIQNYGMLESPDPGDTMSQETIGGKNVTVIKRAGSTTTTWTYANGDVMWSVVHTDQKVAEVVFAALP
jgi:hypothetical protein